MLEQELKEIWKNSSEAEKIKFDLSRLMMDLERKMNTIDREIRRRDRREIGTSAVAIPLFGFLAYEIPFPLSKVGIVLSMVWFAFVIYKLKSVQKYKRPIDCAMSFQEQLNVQKLHLKKQFDMINSILYWYLIPPFIFFTLTIIGFGDPSDYNWSSWLANKVFPFSLGEKIANVVICVLLYAAILWMNKNSAKTNLKPLIEEIDRVQAQLQHVN